MTAQYLDKEKVLKAIDECPGCAGQVRSRIGSGEFDTKPLLSDEAVQSRYRETLSEKDEEIARLKVAFNERSDSATQAWNGYGKLKARIAELEKLTALQKEPTAPQPSAVPTSGTGTAPEGATGICKFASWLDGYVLCKSPDECDYQEGAGFQQQYCGKYPSGSTYPGMAKDIGDLTLRVDNLKIASEAHEQIFRAHGKMIQDLQQKRLMDDSRGNTFEGQIDRLETALEALQEEVAGIKKNPILSTYDPTPRTFTTTVSDQYTQTGSYNPCQNCQTLAEFNRQHPNGYVGDGYPCNLCPNNPGRVACSK